jgi:chaperonin GroES
MRIKPLGDRVVIKVNEKDEFSPGGILIPTLSREKPLEGTVVAVGKGAGGNPLTVQVGDTVIYGKYSGTEIQFENEEYLIMKESDIYAII